MSFLKCPKLWAYLALTAALLCIGTIAYSIIGVRIGLESMNFRTAGTVITLVVKIGVGVIVASVLALIYASLRKERHAQIVSALAVLIVAVPVMMTLSAQPEASDGPPSPPLNDISTDTQNPPLFDAVASIRPEQSNTLEYPANGPEIQGAQFPDIAPIQSALSQADAFDRAIEVVNDMGWDLVAEDSSTGIIEAVSSTKFFSFEDDVVIRVSANGSGSIVDIRSHSRVGRGDRGKNAERVRAFIADY